MDYLLENLGDERFQELCQALLAKEQSNVQCFPIGQQDGGRDAIAFYDRLKRDDGFRVFQVKYVRKPLAESAPHKWLLDTMEKEAPKLNDLIPKGAKSYVLMTNVPGTAHLDVGSIDKCNEVLRKNLTVPFECWWREDINRRLDNAFDLKWAYPEIMSGADMLRLVIESDRSADQSRRTTAIRAFVRTQFDHDADVRFKQVELHNSLLDLFVDVPLGLGKHAQGFFMFPTDKRFTPEPYMTRREEALGAAEWLLDPRTLQALPQVVIEGAPGQGKSTLAQYVCQVHRMHLLDDQQAIQFLAPAHRPKSRQLPFKVDLRDLAIWLGRQNPFTSSDNGEPPEGWSKSIESFLAAQIRHYSGGMSFDVNDLHAVIRLSAVLIVLDGLDEVPSIPERREVISEVIAGTNRLRDSAASLQVVITSRPSVFAASVSFPEKDFPRLRLLSLSKPLIFAYADKWIAARQLDERDAESVKKVLQEKIEEPHLRDLAQNPMQLTILLSLMHTRGVSLPDKRTALYDKYVELFFNREAEKSKVVAENRDLLIDLHRYLAWMLHQETGRRVNRCSLTEKRLRSLLFEYLRSEERDTNLVDRLFTGLVERVVFLVSRIEGTFEFEVQPLREYFTARHLYETAPYSPTGDERCGTKPERFDAIAPHPYWLNVARFFAGCFSKGELSCLIDRLYYLDEQETYRHTSHLKRLAAMLLGDWVFSQDQRALRRAVEFVLAGTEFLISDSRRLNGHLVDTLVLPKDYGRDELIRQSMSVLDQMLPSDYATEVFQLLRSNGCKWNTQYRNHIKNRIAKCSSTTEFTYWLRCASETGLLRDYSADEVSALFGNNGLKQEYLIILLRSGHSSFVTSSEENCRDVLDGILALKFFVGVSEANTFERLCSAINPAGYGVVYRTSEPIPLHEIFKRYDRFHDNVDLSPSNHTEDGNSVIGQCEELIKVAQTELQKNAADWRTDIAPWDTLVEKSRSLWGERLIHIALANLAAAINAPSMTCIDCPELLDQQKSLCRRVRYARLRRATPAWWDKQFDATSSSDELVLVSAVFFKWAGAATVIKIIDHVQSVVDRLSENDWLSIQSVLRSGGIRPMTQVDLSSLQDHVSPRIVALLGSRMMPKDQGALYLKYLQDYSGHDKIVLSFCQEALSVLVRSQPHMWQQALSVTQTCYNLALPDWPWWYAKHEVANALTIEVALQIAQNPFKYPISLAGIAEHRLQADAEHRLTPVGTVAKKEKWFVHK